MGYKIAIDASRNRSGGARAHLIGIISELKPFQHNIEEVHVWSYKALLDSLPDFPWLIRHCPPQTESSLIKQLLWQYKQLPIEATRHGCNIMLNTDAGTVCPFRPAVTMSRDMLSFERREIGRYGFGKDWLRLFILRFVQIRSLKQAEGALFLTNYAANVIQTWSGKLKKHQVIPHGVGNNFKNNTLKSSYPENKERPIHCLYVSNVTRYKHQWNVAKAIAALREKGHDITLQLIGGGQGPAQKKLEGVLSEIDPGQKFIWQDNFLKHNQIPDALAKADIFIFASSCENMPNTLVEAMSCGLPIACSNLGPMPEVLEDGGEYFDPEDIDTIVGAIETLITDKNKRQYSAYRSKMLAQQYSWERCARDTMEYLIEVLNKSKKNEKVPDLY